MAWPPWMHYPVATIGTAAIIVAVPVVYGIGRVIIQRGDGNFAERFGKRKFLLTILVLGAALGIVLLWARLLQHTGTFLGILGAGLAVALREPLLSIAGRIDIFAGHMYSVGDRIEINEMTGDVMDVGFFYTRMMEVGNWIGGDQASGRIVQFANAQIFGAAVFNYTQNFSYVWDEIKFPVTYASDIPGARRILMQAGEEYTREFLHEAEAELEKMRHYFLVPAVELKPAVFMKVTDNWVELTLRYVVAPKKRRIASSFIYERVCEKVQETPGIVIASTTMEVTVHPPKSEAAAGQADKQPPQDAPRKAA